MENNRISSVSCALVSVSTSSLQVLEAEGLQPVLDLTPSQSAPASCNAAATSSEGVSSKPGEAPVFTASAVCLLGTNGSVAVAANQQKPQLLTWNLLQPSEVRPKALPSLLTSLCSDEDGAFLFGGDSQGVLRIWQGNSLLVSASQQTHRGKRPSPVAVSSIADAALLQSCLRASVAVADASIVGLYIHRELLVVSAEGGILKAYRWVDLLNSQLPFAELEAGMTAGRARGAAGPSRRLGSSLSPKQTWRGLSATASHCAFLQGPALHTRSSPWLLLAASEDSYLRVFAPDCDECIEAFSLPEVPESLLEDSLRPCESRAFVGGAKGRIFVLPITAALAAGGCRASGVSAWPKSELEGTAREYQTLVGQEDMNERRASLEAASPRPWKRPAPLTLSGHVSAVTALAFINRSSKSRTLLSGGADGFRVWDAEALTCLYTLDSPGLCSPTEGLKVWGLLSSPENRRVLPGFGLLSQNQHLQALAESGPGRRQAASGGGGEAQQQQRVVTCFFERFALRRQERRMRLLAAETKRRLQQRGEEARLCDGPRRLLWRLRQLEEMRLDSSQERILERHENEALTAKVHQVARALAVSEGTVESFGIALEKSLAHLKHASEFRDELATALRLAEQRNRASMVLVCSSVSSNTNSSADDSPEVSPAPTPAGIASSKLQAAEAFPEEEKHANLRCAPKSQVAKKRTRAEEHRNTNLHPSKSAPQKQRGNSAQRGKAARVSSS